VLSLGTLHTRVGTHVKIESKSDEQMRPTKSDKAEGGYHDVCHEHDKMTFIIEADTMGNDGHTSTRSDCIPDNGVSSQV